METSRIALVTGGNRGIGYAICRALAQRGLTVMLAARDANEGAQAAETLRKESLPVEFVTLDVNDEASIRKAIDTVVKQYGRIDVLVNNAGVMLETRGALTLTCDPQLYRDTFEINVLGPLRLAQAVAPLMKQHGYGRIVNVSSRAGQLAKTKVHTGTPVYSISKTALNALTRMLALELEGSGVLVNAMTPGWVRTRMGGQDAPLSPEQAADTAAWLATLPDDGPTGGFFHERQPIAW